MTKEHNAEDCCGTTADKLRTLRYIKKLEKDNRNLRSDAKAKDKLIEELLDVCESAGLKRVFDS